MTKGINDVIIETLGQLLDATTPTIPDPASGRLRDCAVYRGLADSTWSLLTSLDRLGGASSPHSKAPLEEHILRNFLRYSRPHMKHGQISMLELLVAAQHHGLPTRLLDWTYSPLVAAHFATIEHNEGMDRVVWRLDWVKVHEHFGLQPLAFLESDFEDLLHKRGLESIWDLFRVDDTFDKPFVSTRNQTSRCLFSGKQEVLQANKGEQRLHLQQTTSDFSHNICERFFFHY